MPAFAQASEPNGPVGAIRLDHLACTVDPLPAERLDEQSSHVAVHRRTHVVDARDRSILVHRRHRYSKSARE